MAELAPQHQGGFGMSLATTKMIAELSDGTACPYGTQKTDKHWQDTYGYDTRPNKGKNYGHLMTAIAHALRIHGITWKRVRGEGYISRVLPEQMIQHASAARRHVHRVGKRTCNELASVSIGGLTTEQQREHLGAMAMFGTLTQFSTSTSAKRLTARNSSDAIDVSKLLEAMK